MRKYKKPVGGVYTSQDWSQSKETARKNEHLFLNSKKLGSKSEKLKFTNIFTKLCQGGQ